MFLPFIMDNTHTDRPEMSRSCFASRPTTGGLSGSVQFLVSRPRRRKVLPQKSKTDLTTRAGKFWMFFSFRLEGCLSPIQLKKAHTDSSSSRWYFESSEERLSPGRVPSFGLSKPWTAGCGPLETWGPTAPRERLRRA